jgi:glycosyltransferase involved in cell wall biosynthesis
MDNFIDCFPKFKNKIACLPIGAKILHSEKNEEKPKEIELLSKPHLLHVGGFVPEKNHKGLLNIFSKLLIEIPTANLLLVGEGKLKDKIISLAKELNIEKQVHFLGKRNDVNQLMKYSDVFVMPSLIEGLPGVILESFSNYLPVIAYDTGGIKEIVINNKTGWLIKKNDEADFLQAIKFSVNNDSTEIVNNAINLLKNEYSIETVAKKFESSYQKIVTE